MNKSKSESNFYAEGGWLEDAWRGAVDLSQRIGAALTTHITVFGWDNVLFPGHAIYRSGGLNQEDFFKLEIAVLKLLNKCLEWNRKMAIVTWKPRDYVVGTCRELMPEVWQWIVMNKIEIISTENAKDGASPVAWKRDIFKSIIKKNRLPIVPCKFMSVGCGIDDHAASWGLEGQVIAHHRMRVLMFSKSTSIDQLAHRVEILNSNFSDYMRSRLAVGDPRAPQTRE